MAVTTLTLKFKYPEFASVPDEVLQFAIDEAALSVDSRWIEKHRNLAVIHLAAHYLMVAEARAAVYEERGRQVVSERIGQLSTTYAQNAQSNDGKILPGDLQTTHAGAQFLRLAEGSFPGVAVV